MLHTWSGFHRPWTHCVLRQQVHRIIEQPGLEETLNIIWFQVLSPSTTARLRSEAEEGDLEPGRESQPRGTTSHWQPMHSRQVWNGASCGEEGEKEEPSRGFSHFASNKSPVSFLFLCSNQTGRVLFHSKGAMHAPLLFPPFFILMYAQGDVGGKIFGDLDFWLAAAAAWWVLGQGGPVPAHH